MAATDGQREEGALAPDTSPASRSPTPGPPTPGLGRHEVSSRQFSTFSFHSAITVVLAFSALLAPWAPSAYAVTSGSGNLAFTIGPAAAVEVA